LNSPLVPKANKIIKCMLN